MKNVTLVPIDSIELPPAFNRWGDSTVKDDMLRKSVETGGVQQPVTLLRVGEELRLIKGSRRIGAARTAGIPKVPAVIEEVPEGEEPEMYAKRLRFVLTWHRQDLMPSQKATMIEQLKSSLKLNNEEVARYLGVESDSVRNWLRVLNYAPEVVEAMDEGWLTQQRARLFDGMTKEGQKTILQKHRSELVRPGQSAHKQIRSLYPPSKFPKYYENAKVTESRMQRVQQKRKSRPRVNYSHEEKRRQLSSVTAKEEEITMIRKEIEELRVACRNAGPVVAAILRNNTLSKFLTPEMAEELAVFSESY